MNHGNFNDFDDWTNCLMQVTDSSLSLAADQEFVDDQPHLAGTTTNIAAAVSEIMRPGEFNQTLNSYTETGHVTTEQILQHDVISTQIANNNTMKETSGILDNVTGVDPANKLERKRKSDREYRQRCKAIKEKTEEELRVLQKENALLRGRLQSANSKQMLELKSDGEQNDSDQLCKMEFRLDCHNVKLRGEAMKIVGEFSGLKWFSMDVEEKKLTLYGKHVDNLPLQNKLNKICNASLRSFSFVTKKDEEKKEERTIMDMVVARSSTLVAQNSMPCTTPYSSPFPQIDSTDPNGGSSEECFRISEAAFISFTSLGPARCCGLF